MVNYAKMGTLYEVGLENIGMAIISQGFKDAARALISATTSSYRAERIAEALAFVDGSGLNLVIQRFGMDVDAEALRQTFYTWTSRQRHKSQ